MKPRLKKIIVRGGIAAIVLGLVGSIGFYKYSTSPHFCNSCHIMKPYYDAWKTSKHKDVACVKCHYAPGKAQDILWQKFQAMSQVVKYVTRTYSSRPFAEIKDSACLRDGCHSKRLLEGKVSFGKGITFDHRPHLQEVRRGRQLRCVSCHSQLVVGRHIEVTLDTCYLCHFKERVTGRNLDPLGGCTSCHTPPTKTFKIGDIEYNHQDFVNRPGVTCQNCHVDSIQGTGDAPKERCFTCHNQPEKIERYDDIPFIHENHITAHNVACFHCHTEIKHTTKTTIYSKPQGSDCSACHVNMHPRQAELYKGTGGKSDIDMPSPMYLAQVDCIGCHIVSNGHGAHAKKPVDVTYTASESACLKCHDENYKGMLDEWKAAINESVSALEPSFTSAESIFEQLTGNEPDYSRLKHLYNDARYNYDFVKSSSGLHNIYYSAHLLQNSRDWLNDLAKEADKPITPAGDSSLLDSSYCNTLCHSRVGVKLPETVDYEGLEMPHRDHIDTGLVCSDCHTIKRHKQLSPKEDRVCNTCHDSF